MLTRLLPTRFLALPPSARTALSRETPGRGRRLHSEAGYALLAVVFLAGMMVLAAAVAAPVLLTQGKREREEELIWRGEQHVRAIKLYYRKNGRFPKEISDLTEAKNGIHFMRKAYKDPMNKGDGAWRFIYVGPGGQLTGSVTRKSITGFPQPAQAALGPQPAAAPPPGQPVQPVRRVVTNPTGDQNPSPTEEGGSETDTETQTDVNPNPLPAPIAAPKAAIGGAGAPVEGQVFGGSLIGVASKVDRRSIKFYNGYGKYKEWEFIWDPQAEAAAAAGASLTLPGRTPSGLQGTQPSPFPSPQPPPQ